MKLFLNICFTLLLVSTTAEAQDYKFGKVSKSELEEKFYSKDSTANASYLYKFRRSYFEYNGNTGFRLVTEIHERIKIYNQEGFEYATKKVWLYKGKNAKESISNFKAYTYNLVNGKIEDTKLKKDGVFKTEVSKYYNEEKFTMPNIKPLCVVEYQYKVYSPFFSNVDEFVFQEDIPTKKIIASFESPEYFNYKTNARGYLPLSPEIEKKQGKINFTSKERATGYKGQTSTSFSNESIDYIKTVHKYEKNDVPALKEEPYVNNMDNYRSSVKYELSYVKYPNSPIDYYSTTWEDVVDAIYDSEDFGGQLKKTNYFKKDIEALIASETDPLVKISKIFSFVKSNVKWNGYRGKYADDGVKKAYQEKVGNVAEINLMLTAMLREAGLQANPVLTSTRSNGVPLFPTRDGYNYVICAVEMENGVILLDATSPYNAPNILPFNVLNWQGRIIRKRGSSSLVDLYPKKNAKRTVFVDVKLDEEGTIIGKSRFMLTNHKALRFRKRYNKANKDKFLEEFENDYGGIEVDNFNVKNENNLSKPVIYDFDLTAEDVIDNVADKIYLSPMLLFTTNENPFKLEERNYPVDFGYPKTDQFNIVIGIPEGYKVEELPEDMNIKMPDNLGGFSYKIMNAGNKLQLNVKYDINYPVIPSQYYATLKEFFNQIVTKENQKVVLTKN